MKRLLRQLSYWRGKRPARSSFKIMFFAKDLKWNLHRVWEGRNEAQYQRDVIMQSKLKVLHGC